MPPIALLAAVVLSGCGLTGGLCANDVIGTFPAPKGAFEAIVFVRNCGATTPFGTNVSIFRPGHKLGDEAGNVFLVSATPMVPVPANRIGGPNVTVQWLADDTLVVRYPAGVEIRRQVLIERGIHILYATLP